MNDLLQIFKDALNSTEGNQFLSAGLILGGITGILLALKQGGLWVIGRIRRAFVYSAYIDNGSSMYTAIADWYYKNYPHKFRSVEANTEYREDSKGERVVGIKIRQFNDFNMLWYKGRLLFIYKDKKTLESAMNLEVRSQDIYTIEGLFAKKVINEILQEAYQDYKSQEENIVGVQIIHHDRWDPYKTVLTDFKPLSKIFSKYKNDLVEDVKRFLSQREYYKTKGIRVKRNYLLSGKGGTGKTSMVFAVADWLKMKVYYINPSKFGDDGAFEKHLRTVEPNSIVLFEDIDIFFSDRNEKKKNKKSEVSFQSLLNALDGANSPSESIMFLTTNYPDKLDPALVRKGRVDKHITMDWPESKDVQDFMADFYDQPVLIQDYEPTMPMSAIQDICLRNENQSNALQEICKKEKIPQRA